MDTFDGSKPNLINGDVIRKLESELNIDMHDEGNKVLNGIGNFYTTYILPNMFPIIVICLLIIYLFIKYVIKKDRDEAMQNELKNKKKKKNKHDTIKNEKNKNKEISPINDQIDDVIYDIKSHSKKNIESPNEFVKQLDSDDVLLSIDDIRDIEKELQQAKGRTNINLLGPEDFMESAKTFDKDLIAKQIFE